MLLRQRARRSGRRQDEVRHRPGDDEGAAGQRHLAATGGPTFQLLQKDEGLSVRYSFPITGGRVNLSALTGAIDHSGGINFVNTNNGKSLLLTNFRIKLASATLTAEVNGNPAARVAILDLDFSRAKIISEGRHVRVKNVDASLTEAAAGALNASLGVTFFSAGIDLGTAQVFARVAA